NNYFFIAPSPRPSPNPLPKGEGDSTRFKYQILIALLARCQLALQKRSVVKVVFQERSPTTIVFSRSANDLKQQTSNSVPPLPTPAASHWRRLYGKAHLQMP